MESHSIRPLNRKEYKALFQLIDQNRDHLRRYFPITLSNANTLRDTKRYVKSLLEKLARKELFPLGVYYQEQLIGMVYIKNIDWRVPKCELGYFISQAQEGKGLMTKTLELATSYCFEELKIMKIFLRISPDNLASLAVARKSGFEKEGLLKKEFRIETDELIDVVYLGKLNPKLIL